MTPKTSPLKLGNEIYGTIKIEEAFLEALKMYFIKQQDKKTPDWLGVFYFSEEDDIGEMIIQFYKSIHTFHLYKNPNVSTAKAVEGNLDNIIDKRYLTI